ncbi:MAG: glutathione binding-like protein [Parvibaculaceae bacterium]|nr:glutathione binding-like protein [Parvibaculaceae bacterium]
MKLYYLPASCSLASHIVLRELGLDFDLERYDPAAGTTDKGTSYNTINAKARVPALALDSGDLLTEGSAIVQYLVATHQHTDLSLPDDLMARARIHEGLSFVASDFHKTFGPLFTTDTDNAAQERAKRTIVKHLDYLESVFADGRDYFVDNKLSVADIYLFVVLRWTDATGTPLAGWKHLNAFRDRINQRPAVQASLAAEGLN